jgi:hypothetical protein
MNDQELTIAVRRSVAGAHMDVPEEQITSRGRAIRTGRRRRVAAGVTAVASAAMAAIAAAVFLPGAAAPAVQQAQDTAYVTSHVTQSLDAVSPSTILYTQDTSGSAVTLMWHRGSQGRQEAFMAGKLQFDVGYALNGTTLKTAHVDYTDKTWWRSTGPLGRPSSIAPWGVAAGDDTCAGAESSESGIFQSANLMVVELRILVSCGTLKADGTATVDGVPAIKLTGPTTQGSTVTWYVSSATYLPISKTIAYPDSVLSIDMQWLAPTAANLANLDLPTAPRGFTQVPPPVR